jgi:hypothetical protein
MEIDAVRRGNKTFPFPSACQPYFQGRVGIPWWWLLSCMQYLPEKKPHAARAESLWHIRVLVFQVLCAENLCLTPLDEQERWLGAVSNTLTVRLPGVCQGWI